MQFLNLVWVPLLPQWWHWFSCRGSHAVPGDTTHYSDTSSCSTPRVDILISKAFIDFSQSKESLGCEFSPTELIATSVLILLIPLKSLLMLFIWWPVIAPVNMRKNSIPSKITFHTWQVLMLHECRATQKCVFRPKALFSKNNN